MVHTNIYSFQLIHYKDTYFSILNIKSWHFYIPVAHSLKISVDDRVKFVNSTEWPTNFKEIIPHVKIFGAMKRLIYSNYRELFHFLELLQQRNEIGWPPLSQENTQSTQRPLEYTASSHDPRTLGSSSTWIPLKRRNELSIKCGFFVFGVENTIFCTLTFKFV
jgi:hypothetical protein